MPDRPLLIFPTPVSVQPQDRHGRKPPIHKPSHSRQGERLSPQFSQLQETFAARRLSLQSTTTGIDPELVLVIETANDITNFSKAIKKIPGLEWMGEYIESEIAPDEDFYIEGVHNRDKKISDRIYLVLTNHTALTQLLSLWNQSQSDSRMIWDRGLTPFRDLFQFIRTIRYWDVQDRLSEAGIYEEWQRAVQNDGSQIVRFEVELWYRSNGVRRESSQRAVNDLITRVGGTVKSVCIIPEISYHSLLAEVPIRAIQRIVDYSDTKLVECDSIMFFKPVGQMATERVTIENDLPEIPDEIIDELSLPAGEPIIALLDGLPLEHHRLLENRMIIDDPDGWSESAYSSPIEQIHGTGMASLIIQGDLNEGIHPLSRPVYIRPILKPDPTISPPNRSEVIPEDLGLGIDLIHRAIRRIFESDGINDASAPTIKIINLSIGYPNRDFFRTMSPLAKLLDWLSYRYNVLIIVSAGNYTDSIQTEIQNNEFRAYSKIQLEEDIIRSLYNDSRNRKILSPAESINSLTVGSLHYDSANVDPNDGRIDLYESPLPSSYSAFGLGYHRSVKPDIVYPGGRILFHTPLPRENNIVFRSACSIRVGPGNQLASPGTSAGDLTKTAFEIGTSNSTALVSRAASQCYDTLIEVFSDDSGQYQPYISPLLKAMIVHGCSWGAIGERLKTILTPENRDGTSKTWLSQWLGYGEPDFEKVRNCREGRATLLGFGQLNHNEANLFRLPLPPSLGGRNDWRRLTITLAWMSPVVPSSQKYRMASLWFDTNVDSLMIKRSDVDWKMVRRGTVQHEIFEGLGSTILPFTDGESLNIRVNCKNDAGTVVDPIKFGLIVSLEVAEGIDIPIYDEIRTMIAPTVQIRPRASHSASQ